MNSSIDSMEKFKQHSDYAFLFYSQEYKNIIKELLTSNSASTKHLQACCGLSRSATLNRLKYLTKKGLISKKPKTGTEHWNMPHYEFSLAVCGKTKSNLTELLGVQEVSVYDSTSSSDYQDFEWSKLGEILLEMAKQISSLKNTVTELEAKAIELDN